MLQIDTHNGTWILRWNDIQICPPITDIETLISLHQQITLLLIVRDAQQRRCFPGNTKTD